MCVCLGSTLVNASEVAAALGGQKPACCLGHPRPTIEIPTRTPSSIDRSIDRLTHRPHRNHSRPTSQPGEQTGGKLTIKYVKKTTRGPHCGDCKISLPGVRYRARALYIGLVITGATRWRRLRPSGRPSVPHRFITHRAHPSKPIHFPPPSDQAPEDEGVQERAQARAHCLARLRRLAVRRLRAQPVRSPSPFLESYVWRVLSAGQSKGAWLQRGGRARPVARMMNV